MKLRISDGLIVLALVLGACDSSDLDSDEEARRAYLGLDASVAKALQLGFDGFNAATSANIDPQTTTGVSDGTLTVTGQVDQGSSDNKGMRLRIGMVGYSDGEIEIGDDETILVTYDTSELVDEQPFLDLQLKAIPDGTLDGSLVGDYAMSGALEGTATLDLTFTGDLMDGGDGTVIRAPGTTHVTGTLTNSDGGVFDVDITI